MKFRRKNIINYAYKWLELRGLPGCVYLLFQSRYLIRDLSLKAEISFAFSLKLAFRTPRIFFPRRGKFREPTRLVELIIASVENIDRESKHSRIQIRDFKTPGGNRKENLIVAFLGELHRGAGYSEEKTRVGNKRDKI